MDYNTTQLRLAEVQFSTMIENLLEQKNGVQQINETIGLLCKLIEHPAPLLLSEAVMATINRQLRPGPDELVILLHTQGLSKNSIRKYLKLSPNRVYDIIKKYNEDPFIIRCKLNLETSRNVMLFTEGVKAFVKNFDI